MWDEIDIFQIIPFWKAQKAEQEAPAPEKKKSTSPSLTVVRTRCTHLQIQSHLTGPNVTEMCEEDPFDLPLCKLCEWK